MSIHRGIWTSLVVLAIATGGRAQQDATPTRVSPSGRATFRAAVELVALNVTVTDEHGRFTTGLGRDDFLVYENGVRQPLEFFGTATIPVDVALLLDMSSSMHAKLRLLHEAASGFVRTLRHQDRASVIGFAHRMEVLQPLTGDLEALEAAIQRTRPVGYTALYDAVYITLTELGRERKRYEEARRQIVVVLSDGHDTASIIGGEEALTAARRGGATIYTIWIEPRTNRQDAETLLTQVAAENAFILKRLGGDTGGRSFSPGAVRDLAGVYAEIAAEMAHQYVLAYVPGNSLPDGRFRQVIVRVASRPDARVRTRPGYYPIREP